MEDRGSVRRTLETVKESPRFLEECVSVAVLVVTPWLRCSIFSLQWDVLYLVTLVGRDLACRCEIDCLRRDL